jgi:MFS family permease
MCFSAQADLVGGAVLAGIGLDAVRHVRRRHDHLALATLPFLLAAHQLDETLVWWGLQGHINAEIGRVATWIYLLFAFFVLPIYVPLAVFALEPPGRRRSIIAGFVVLGAVVSTVLLIAMLSGPVTATLGDHHIGYGIGLHAGLAVTVAYVAATCGPMIFSGYHRLFLFGIVNLIAVAVLARLAISGFASLWCAWAALTAAVIAVYLRSGDAHRSVVDALA